MREVTHTRKGKQIINLSTGVVEDFPSINQAKYRSRKLQSTSGVVLRKIARKLKDRVLAFGSRELDDKQVRRMRSGG